MRWRLMLAFGLAGGLGLVAAPHAQVTTTTSAGGGSTSISGMPALEPPVFGTGIVSGVVTDATTGLPLEGVFVSLSGGKPGPAGRPQQMTDPRGRFLFTHLTAANY